MQILCSGKNSTKNPVTLSLPTTGLVHEYSPAEVRHFVHNLHYRHLPQLLDLWRQVLLLLPCSLPWMKCLLTFLRCHFAESEMSEGTTGMSLSKKNLTVAIFQLVSGFTYLVTVPGQDLSLISCVLFNFPLLLLLF